jgi:hypothetical protein
VWLDGAHGWHNTYRVVDTAVVNGFKLDPTDSAIIERYRRGSTGWDCVGECGDTEAAHEISAEATEYLQSLVTDDYLMFVWDAGELSLTERTDHGY